MNFVNKQSKNLDSLDLIKIRVSVAKEIKDKQLSKSYVVMSDDGFPMCGFYIRDEPTVVFTCINWKTV